MKRKPLAVIEFFIIQIKKREALLKKKASRFSCLLGAAMENVSFQSTFTRLAIKITRLAVQIT